MAEEPTREGNILDLLFTTAPDLVENVQVHPAINDHDLVTPNYALKASVNKKPQRKVFVFKKADSDTIKREPNELNQQLAAEHFQSTDVYWNQMRNHNHSGNCGHRVNPGGPM